MRERSFEAQDAVPPFLMGAVDQLRYQHRVQLTRMFRGVDVVA
ncbi:hypothetical protein I546_2172 [Mycobacterium kansasii 732]|nr:hypothetical protein I546_2172 [Mycobacterium kansasii 732]